ISQIRLRGLAWNALQRGTALLVITRDYREILFVDPRFVGNPTKSNVRVNKLKMVVSDATRHDLDTLNAIHAFRRTGQQIYDAQATAFNVTAITKKFYEEYRRYYEKARTAVRQYNKGIREFQDEDQTDKLHAFTQRLMGRLMFLYFLQRKGWLGGRPKFLTDQYQAAIRDHASEIRGNDETFYYYREVLEPLFFETMNTRRPDNVTRWSGIRIPYLNGGLFDEGRDPTGPIILPDSLFDLHDGLLAFFNRYNFTIADDTPLEQDVAVDPEMLGKVFENMLEERDRGQSGSFYTPRAIVAYMCQEALAGYLEESATVSRETVRAQFDPDSTVQFTPEEAEHVNAALDTLTVLDPAVGSGSFLIGMLHEIIRVRKAAYLVLHGDEAPRTTLAAWKEQIIRDTLYGVDIKPEAIEIAQLRLWLALVVDQTLEEAHPLPNLDYKLMAGNSLIETLDGEPVLSEKAMLYLESDHGTNIHAPTQDNFLGIPTQSRMALFEGEAAVESQHRELANLRRDYFSASPDNRRALRQEITRQERNIVLDSLREKANHAQQLIDKIGKKIQDAQSTAEKSKSQQVSKRDIDQLNAAVARLERLQNLMADIANPDKPLPFFLYRLQFSDVFKTKGGFDVVIANPP
ncbi:MAG: SAM-dependent DNA methyltransferase, partial [Anaerolineae bacterium]